MKRLSLLVVLPCAATSLVNCQQPTKSSTTPKPDEGSFVQNTCRNDFFGFSYALPREWQESSVVPAIFPAGAYYLFIGDRNTGHSLLNRVMVIADPKSESGPGVSTQEYLSAFIRAQVRNANAEVIQEPSSFVSGENSFYRADQSRLQKRRKWDYGLQLHALHRKQELLAQLELCDTVATGPRRCGEYTSTYFFPPCRFRSNSPRWSRALDGSLSRLVHQRAPRKPISDARTATYVICPLVRDQEVDGSNPFAPTTSFRTNNLQHAKERKTAWCKTRRSAVQFDSRPTALNPPFSWS